MARALLLASALCASACVENLRPPTIERPNAAPAVAVDPGPASAGQSRVVIQTLGAPARVDEIVGAEVGRVDAIVAGRASAATYEGLKTRPVCARTPCAVNLERGHHELLFSPLETEGDEQGFRRQQGAFGITVGTGSWLVAYALPRVRSDTGCLVAGLILTGLLATAFIGGPILASCPIKQQAGAGEQWPLVGTAGRR